MIKKSSKGVSLVELIVAAFILASVGLSIALFAPKAMQAIVRVQARTNGVNLATSRLQETTSHPYAMIPVTPRGQGDQFFLQSTAGQCDCNNVDWTHDSMNSGMTSSNTVAVGGISYTAHTCVNYVQYSAIFGWHSNCFSDKGTKQIVTHVDWQVGNAAQSFTVASVASPPAALGRLAAPTTGSFNVTVCPADGLDPPGCDNANLAAVTGAEVAVYNASFLAENNHGISQANNVAGLNVPPGANYTLHVQQPGFFPYYAGGYSVTAGVPTNVTVALRDLSRYGSTVSGEVFLANHPVISKVIPQVMNIDTTGGCTPPGSGTCSSATMDRTEAVELYNPTVSTFTVGGPAGAGQITLDFCACKDTANPCTVSCVNGETFASWTGAPKALNSGSYVLIEQRDTATNEWAVAPDIYKNSMTNLPALAAGDSGYISYKSGGYIQLKVNGVVQDAVGWTGDDGSKPAVQGGALATGIVRPAICR